MNLDKKYLPILAIETSGENCSTSLFFSMNEIFSVEILKKHVHSQKLLNCIDSLLNLAEISIKEIGSLAISNGPGSFTGLRIGLTTVKGLALGAEKSIIPVPTLGAMALSAVDFVNDDDTFAIASQVNRDELYFQKFLKKNHTILEDGNLEVISKSELGGKLKRCNYVFSDMKELNSSYIQIKPNAEYVAKWSYINGNNVITNEYDYLEPNYYKNFVAKVKQ
ncbi:MAG: tRNA (adenosine(37)-N6)-threonylcarbamoyltransferase complex dimerization subunit type 1 TsaB [Melioribacteraceae bacterium]|nr:tRNA (adenosine(37)-N6)-threonylcarbamoyltransferase complex dimerization subunit type 1 TsaB [Melioribacteraceae bacterium]MCF8263633.1 tRNA (adenosine(37)-N6)-threonylcarbamoyltransferase complex dimerization subunit type 1 TsaB [Melioribacteraceae bacterium]MCF8431887.1 tRNA (adenosine(37)-N6)-threonylcarbamoyltransferase complex dimerization subunit type 1 TsaB [Melioribacteraceae bacterium]